MTTDNGSPSKIIPNSFQTPNFFVDKCMGLLSGNEFMCMVFVSRKTFGWQKRSDRIAKQQITRATGLTDDTVDKCMAALVDFGLVLRMSENNASNTGVEWALQIDDSLIRFDLMQKRREEQKKGNRRKTDAAREKLLQRKQGVGVSNNPPWRRCLLNRQRMEVGVFNNPSPQLFNRPRVGLSNIPHKSHYQKPKKRTWTQKRPR